MHHARRITALLALGLLGTACASGGASTDTESESASPRVSRSRNVITQAEIEETTAENAYQVVQRLRNAWLRGRGASSGRDQTTRPVVFIDNVRAGTVEALERIRASDIAELRYHNARDATTRWGTGYSGGVIEVIRKGGN
jgi:hypothetical protein